MAAMQRSGHRSRNSGGIQAPKPRPLGYYRHLESGPETDLDSGQRKDAQVQVWSIRREPSAASSWDPDDGTEVQATQQGGPIQDVACNRGRGAGRGTAVAPSSRPEEIGRGDRAASRESGGGPVILRRLLAEPLRGALNSDKKPRRRKLSYSLASPRTATDCSSSPTMRGPPLFVRKDVKTRSWFALGMLS